jgi:hypothetical protein
MSSVGTKVTKDPAAKQEKPEAVGVVTSDSLAAESLKGSGSFGEGNPHAAASKQPSKSTTTNNTDTSGATTLPPAVDAEAREAREGWSEEQQLNAGKDLGKDAGIGPTYNVSTGSGAAGSGGSGGYRGPGAAFDASGADTAPTGGYAGAADQARAPGEFKPKGANLTETDNLEGKGAFPEVGTENDPARAAEQDLGKRNALPGGAAGGSKDLSGPGGDSKFSALGDEAA